MSVTFHVEGSNRDSSDDEPEMNLSNSNARALLSALSFNDGAEDLCGYLDPAQTLAALAVMSPGSLVKRPSDNGGVHITENGVSSVCRILDGGRSYDQVSRYVDNLRRIALAAQSAGVRISFG